MRSPAWSRDRACDRQSTSEHGIARGGRTNAAELAGEVARHYAQAKTWREIATATSTTISEVHQILGALFAEGMPKLERRRMGDEQARTLHTRYLRGERSVAEGASDADVTHSTVYRRWRALGLPLDREYARRSVASRWREK
jgi:hypothetical protein